MRLFRRAVKTENKPRCTWCGRAIQSDVYSFDEYKANSDYYHRTCGDHLVEVRVTLSRAI